MLRNLDCKCLHFSFHELKIYYVNYMKDVTIAFYSEN